ncbi:hypothetical protein ECAE60S_01489 [Eoetvoesiella caeni]
MSTAFHCKCQDCGHTFSFSDGGGFSWIQRLCSGCGKSISLPRYAPRCRREGTTVIPQFLRKIRDVNLSPIPYENTGRFNCGEKLQAYLDTPQQWVRHGDDWDASEIKAILNMTGACGCGGTWVDPSSTRYPLNEQPYRPHSLRRCSQCKSKNYSFEVNLDVLAD